MWPKCTVFNVQPGGTYTTTKLRKNFTLTKKILTIIQNVGPVPCPWTALDTVVCQHPVTRNRALYGSDSSQSIKLEQLQKPLSCCHFDYVFPYPHARSSPPSQIAFYWFRLTARFIIHARIASTLILLDWHRLRRLKERHATPTILRN